MSEENQEQEAQTFSYRVARGVIRKPRSMGNTNVIATRRDFFIQNELIPDGIFGQDDIKSWLADGRIVSAQVSMEQAEEAVEAARARGKFQADPASLVGKTMEELLIMVNEIDEDYDFEANPIEDEQAAVRLLTSDWDPRYADRIAPVSDRSRPEALVAHDMEQVDDVPATSSSNGPEPSQEASAALANARARAQAPADAAE